MRGRAYENALRAAGAIVQIEAVEFLPEVSTRDTPESLLIAAEEGAEIERCDLATARLSSEDERAGTAYTMTSTDRPLSAVYVAAALRTTPDEAERIIAGAHARHAEIVRELAGKAVAR